MNKVVLILEIAVGGLMTAAILLQSKSASLGEAFGGSSAFYGSRRGVEKTLFVITVILGVVFVGLAYLLLFI